MSAAKVCRGCNSEKPLGDFSPRASARDGRASQCKECQREKMRAYRAAQPEKSREAVRKYKQKYNGERAKTHGMLPADKRAWLDEIGWKCEVCASPFEKPSDAHVDHDHECCPGTFSCGACKRGLLCGACNRALGLLRDDPQRLATAILYLDRYKDSLP